MVRCTSPPSLCAEDVVEEAWNATLLSCERRYKGAVQSLEFDVNISEGIPRLAVLDAGRAKQVITNTVGNAIKARGKKTLALRRENEPPQSPVCLVL